MDSRHLPYWMIFLLCIAGNSSHAQQQKDSSFVFALINKAEDFFSGSEYDSALYYCDLAAQYSRTKNYHKGLAYTLIERCDILIDKDDLQAALLLPPAILGIGQQLKDSLIMAIANMQSAQIRMYNNQPDEALPFFEKSIRYGFDRYPSRYAALAYNDLGYTYGLKGNLNDKAVCLLRSIKIYESLGEGYYGEKAAAYNNLATVYYELKQKDKTIEYALKSIAYREKSGDIERLAIGCCNLSQFYLGVNNDEALKYQKLCVKYSEQSGDQSRILHSYTTSALIANEQKDTTTALNYELKIINMLEKSGKDQLMLARRYISAGMAYSQRDSAAALSYFKKSVQLSEKLKDKFNLRDVYYQLALLYRRHQNFEQAYESYNKHILYRDSIVKNNTASTIADLEKKYETEKKDNLIARLNDAQSIKTLQIEKQRALIARNRTEAEKKQNDIDLLSKTKELQELKIAQQDELLEKQMLTARNNQQQLELTEKENLLQEKQLRATRMARNLLLAGVVLILVTSYFLFNRYQLKRKIAAQQALINMRNDIAKDLHDEIGSTLTSIRILSEASGKFLQNDNEKAGSFIHQIREQSAAAQQGMSDIVWAVTSDNDKLENLVARMREYAAHTLDPKDIITTIQIDEQLLSLVLNMQQRRDIFLIYKEAVNNIAKYAEANKVSVYLEKTEHHLRLRITDNGRGFDVNTVKNGNGLRNMKARAASLNGSLILNAAPNEGTSVQLEMPVT